MSYLWVGVGSALGGIARYWLTWAVAAAIPVAFPWGTLLINVIGSFVIGWFGALTGSGGRADVDQNVRLFVMVGICGGFTTFSSFSLQTFELLNAGYLLRGAAYVGGSVVLCLAAVWGGVMVGRL
jgi:CrcB protein